MENIYRVAADGFRHEVGGHHPFSCVDPEWYEYAQNRDAEFDSLPSLSVVMVVTGGAKVTVNGDVGEGSIILCAGGGATVEVFGNIGKDVRIMAMGGAAEIIYHGESHTSARLVARGGGSKVTKVPPPKPVEVLSIQVYVVPEQVGTMTPYRMVRNGSVLEPMDLADVQREVDYSWNMAEKRGVAAVLKFWKGVK